ncbi:hypothetical protein K502DRAFT_189440 [Neoconidiobolus thromboides FSU 785]|nr:hypothetical protein K502DRAFT_189440 [Neoconidiobolus thromboides FSU 785]
MYSPLPFFLILLGPILTNDISEGRCHNHDGRVTTACNFCCYSKWITYQKECDNFNSVKEIKACIKLGVSKFNFCQVCCNKRGMFCDNFKNKS